MKCYYAHCQNIYGTKQEKRDIKTLNNLGFEVMNPGSRKIQDEFEEWKKTTSQVDKMIFFDKRVEECDILAFRAIPCGAIPSGVQREINIAIGNNSEIIELPSFALRSQITVGQTRQYLSEIGQR